MADRSALADELRREERELRALEDRAWTHPASVEQKDLAEVDLAAIVAEHFRVRGYEVFQEVNLGGRCDIVARYHRLAYAVEVKRAANLVVLAQAVRHSGHAHAIYVAVPMPRRKTLDEFCTVAATCGVGVLCIGQDGLHGVGVVERVTSRLTRWLAPQREAWLRQTLTARHVALGGVAGSAASTAAWTGFRQFQFEVWQTLRRTGPLTVAELAVKLRESDRAYAYWRWSSDVLARRALHGYLSKNLMQCLYRLDGRPAKWAALDEFEASLPKESGA